MFSIGMAYFLAAVAASGVFVVAGRRSKRVMSLSSAQGQHVLPIDPLWGETESDPAPPQSQADVTTAIRLALKRLGPVMASQSVQTEVATSSGLRVRMQGAALTDVLEELVAAAIHNAPASRLLLAAAKCGDRVYISVTDDMPGANVTLRTGSVRGLMERIALRGGALDVAVSPSEGTTMTLRFAAVNEDRQDRDPPEAAKCGEAVFIPSMEGISFGRTR